MIFVTVGTEKFPFNRLLKLIDHGKETGQISEDVFGQIGCATYVPLFYPYRAFLSFEEMIWYVSNCSVVVAHAGVGSTLLCLRIGRIPILFPRSAAKGEHLDNHQIEFADMMEKEQKAIVARNLEELAEKIRSYRDLVEGCRRIGDTSSSRNSLIQFLRGTIWAKCYRS